MSTLSLRELKQGFLHLFYPHLCEGCSKPLIDGEEILCLSCSLQLPETNYHHIPDNETAIRFAGRVPFIKATTYAWFTNDGLLQHLIHGLKYKGKKEIGYFLGQKLAKELKTTIDNDGQNWATTIDMIIPVPLHKTKQAKRGYNQSMLIAEGMSSVLAIPVNDKLLIRGRDTETQTHKTRIERVNNMNDAFSVTAPDQLSGKHILLCDDVLTTGATAEACAHALLAAANVKISIVTIGIAVS